MAIAAWFDDFDSSLDGRWTSVTSGSGTVTVSGDELQLGRPAATDVAYVYYNQLIPTNLDWIMIICGETPSNSDWLSCFITEATSPTAAALGTAAAKCPLRLQGGVNVNRYAVICKRTDAGTQTTWDNGALGWASGTNNSSHLWPISEYTTFIVQNDGTNQRWRAGVYGADHPYTATNKGMALRSLTDWVNWSATLGTGNNTWWLLGNPVNDSYSGTTKLPYVKLLTGSRVYRFYNGQATLGAGMRIRRAWSCGAEVDGLTLIPEDRSTIAVDVGSGGSWDDSDTWARSVIQRSSDSKIIMAYMGNDGSVFKVGFAYADTAAGTFTKNANNPIFPRASASGSEPAPSTHEALFTSLVEDLGSTTQRWKIAVGIITTASSAYETHLYTAASSVDLTTCDEGDWVWEGKMIAMGSGYISNAVVPGDLWFENGQWEFWVSGNDASSPTRSAYGRYTGTNLLSLTADPDNPIVAAASLNNIAVTGSMTNSVTVACTTTGFVKNAAVYLRNTGGGVADWIRNRVKSIDSGSQLTLMHPLTLASSIEICQIGGGDRNWVTSVVKESGVYYFYGTSFGHNDTAYNEDSFLRTASTVDGAQSLFHSAIQPMLLQYGTTNLSSGENLSSIRTAQDSSGGSRSKMLLRGVG